MIVVTVRDQDRIELRQVVDLEGRGDVTFRPERGQRRNVVGEDGIGQHRPPADADQGFLWSESPRPTTVR